MHKFYDAARTFYTKVYEYCVKWLYLDDGFVKQYEFVDLFKRNNIPFNYVEKNLAYFRHIHQVVVKKPNKPNQTKQTNKTKQNKPNIAQDEYIEYQSMIKDKMPEKIWQEVTLAKERYRINVV